MKRLLVAMFSLVVISVVSAQEPVLVCEQGDVQIRIGIGDWVDAQQANVQYLYTPVPPEVPSQTITSNILLMTWTSLFPDVGLGADPPRRVQFDILVNIGTGIVSTVSCHVRPRVENITPITVGPWSGAGTLIIIQIPGAMGMPILILIEEQ